MNWQECVALPSTKHQIFTRFAVLALFVVSGCDQAPSRSATPTATRTPPADDQTPDDGSRELIDTEGKVPELERFAQGGPDEVRDILVLDDGFLVATGTAVAWYGYAGNRPRAVAEYTTADGLPSGNVFALKQDVDGGVWARCEGGVGYLPKGANRWLAFTGNNGLASGNVTSLAVSRSGERIWVTSTGGLATTPVKEPEWKAFPIKNPIDILVHPTKDLVWCRRLLASRCMCGRHLLTSQFNMATGKWRDIPESGLCAHVAPRPAHFCPHTNRLWFSAGRPPLLYDPAADKVRSWPAQPNWERIVEGNLVEYSDDFGDMRPCGDASGRMWFATNAGLWLYDPQEDAWEGHTHDKRPGVGTPLLVAADDGKTLFWACDGHVMKYGVADDRWTPLWYIEDQAYGDQPDHLALSPDKQTLWLTGREGIFVGQPASRKAFVLTDKQHPGLSDPRFIRFAPNRQLVLIVTRRGVVGSDYAGTLKFSLARSPCPIDHPVERFVFAPDGSEVWCLMGSPLVRRGPDRGRAAIFSPGTGRWTELPDPHTRDCLHDVVFSHDGKTTWAALSSDDNDDLHVQQRAAGSSKWKPIAADMPPYYSTVEKFWLTPDGTELWMDSSGSGLLRVDLTTREVVQYVHSSFRQDDGIEHYPLAEDYVQDLVFVEKGKVALASASGGGNDGVTRIDLGTGKSTNYRVPVTFDRPVVAPDDRTVWCIANHSHLWAFDARTAQWTHKCSTKDGMPLEGFLSLVCSLDGKYVWIRDWSGAAVYSTVGKNWKALTAEAWQESDVLAHPIEVAADGKHILCGHDRGIALIRIDGDHSEAVSPDGVTAGCHVSHIVRIPGTGCYLCAIRHRRAGGLFRFDVAKRELRRLVQLGDTPVTALAIDPGGDAWVALPGRVICLDPKTGQERVFPVAEPAEPLIRDVATVPAESPSNVLVAPRPISEIEVAPRAESVPSRPEPVRLHTKEMVWLSSHVPVIATSASGKAYVTWFAHPKDEAPSQPTLPQIPASLLPNEPGSGGATGINVFDGKKWSAPQLLMSGQQYHDVRFAWCQEEDLHVLVKTARDELHHLVYRPQKRIWTKLHVLRTPGYVFRHLEGMVHVAGVEDRERICYRRFDGREWSEPIWFDAGNDSDPYSLAMAVTGGGTVGLLWKDGKKEIAFVTVLDDKAEPHRQEFPERPIASRDVVLGVDAQQRWFMVYQAELYKKHSDRHVPHQRTWEGGKWSPARLVPFDRHGFDSPVLLQHRGHVLLSWVYTDSVTSRDRERGFSLLRPEGDWSAPLPLCNGPRDIRCGHGVSLYSDPQGYVRAAWHHQEETFHCIVKELGQ